MASFAVSRIRQAPEIWIMQTALRTREPVSTEEFAKQYKYKTNEDALKVLQNLYANRRVKRIAYENGTFGWSYR